MTVASEFQPGIGFPSIECSGKKKIADTMCNIWVHWEANCMEEQLTCGMLKSTLLKADASRRPYKNAFTAVQPSLQ